MTVFRFRSLLVLYGILQVVAFLLPDNYSFSLAIEYSKEPPHEWINQHYWVLAAVLFPFVSAVIAGYIGLFFLKRWALTLALITTLGNLALIPFFGPHLSSALGSMAIYTSHIIWGAVLAIAYYSPLSSQFGANQSFKPTAGV